jgi:hypothetical protein
MTLFLDVVDESFTLARGIDQTANTHLRRILRAMCLAMVAAYQRSS